MDVEKAIEITEKALAKFVSLETKVRDEYRFKTLEIKAAKEALIARKKFLQAILDGYDPYEWIKEEVKNEHFLGRNVNVSG